MSGTALLASVEGLQNPAPSLRQERSVDQAHGAEKLAEAKTSRMQREGREGKHTHGSGSDYDALR